MWNGLILLLGISYFVIISLWLFFSFLYHADYKNINYSRREYAMRDSWRIVI